MSYPAESSFQNILVPNVFEKLGDRGYDIFSYVLKERIVWLGEQVNDALASVICSELLFLAKEDPETDITMYINSPGGSVTAGMGIYDTMNLISPDIKVVVLGQACSMGAFLLSAGTKGKRFVLPNSRVMIHQPSGGAQGTATDMLTSVRLIESMKYDLTLILAQNCMKEGEEFVNVYKRVRDHCERDHWMNADEAVEYGIADKIINTERIPYNLGELKTLVKDAGLEPPRF